MIATTPGRDEQAGAQWFKELHRGFADFGEDRSGNGFDLSLSLSASSAASSGLSSFAGFGVETEPEPARWETLTPLQKVAALLIYHYARLKGFL